MKLLATARGAVTGEKIKIMRRRDGGLELVRIRGRRRVAVFHFARIELGALGVATIKAWVATLEQERAALAGGGTPGPPGVDLRELGAAAARRLQG